MSSKKTSGVSRDQLSRKGFRSTDKIFAKRLSSNQHPKKTVSKRPVTSTNKSKHKFRPESSKLSYTENNGFNNNEMGKRTSDPALDHQSKLKKQMSSKEKQFNYFGPSQTPNVTKGKAELLNSKSEVLDGYEEDASENSYMTVEKKPKKNKFVREESDTSSSYVQSSKYGRSTVTPSRSGIKSKVSVFRLEPEAFEQPSADECQNLIVNLEDIVKEEQMIYNIQECLNKKLDVDETCQRWWD
jgi:hypothetical protein